jgi:arylsulfatase
MLTGQKESIDRAPLLYFNLWNLQCARWGTWKLHIARYNTAAYVPAPPNGIHNYVLPHPELYNLASDPDESYDVAPENPQLVAEMKSKIDELIKGFPEEVRKAWAESMERKVNPATPIGSYPRPTK